MEEKERKGIHIRDEEVKFSLTADDVIWKTLKTQPKNSNKQLNIVSCRIQNQYIKISSVSILTNVIKRNEDNLFYNSITKTT